MNSTRVIADRYELARPIGAGGMGRVWQGTDVRLGREVAVKVVRPDLLDGPQRAEAAARFRREARVTAQIAHPGVPAIFDAGIDEATDELYLVMAYLPGLSLRDLLDESGPLPADWSAAIGAQLASVLAAAHARQVIHRDLKPANIIVGTDGRVSVVDFGIAAILEGDPTRLTATGDKPGTLNYMAPEQIRARPAGPAADLYALGALLYEMVTGERLFAGRGSAYEVQTAHLEETPAPVRRHRPELPSEFGDLVGHLLRKEPGERPGGAAGVYLALAGVLERLPASGAPARDAGDPTWPFRAPLAPPSVAREAAAARGATAPPPPRDARERLAEADRRLREGDFGGALTAFRALAADIEPADAAEALHCQVRAAQCLAALGNTSTALSGLGSVVDRLRRTVGEADRRTLHGRRVAVDMLAALGRGGEAHRALAALAGDMAAALGAGDPDTMEAQRLLQTWTAASQAGPVRPVQARSTAGVPRQ
ncbi:serine/threonine-protein kinase [Glycomyces arizonensis]|uniref:serine/threonine-protein kinase n=1 Tax=Glycomyces arizonensis TaxID=256035 RepID=UPI00041414E4|nr:serine/threonine-protein kinase [Glycomyces arizonensis]